MTQPDAAAVLRRFLSAITAFDVEATLALLTEDAALNGQDTRAVAEFRTSGRRVRTATPYANRYVGLSWTDGARIRRYREYFDPLADRRLRG